MGDQGRTEQTLTLLAKPGVYEILHALHSRGGTATFAQIPIEARRALILLRSLAAEGFVISHHCGSLDIEPAAQTCFSLTTKGEAVAGHLTRLQQWIINRTTRRGSQRPLL
jgi:DNA-binding HxlR family transcriptional regulator